MSVLKVNLDLVKKYNVPGPRYTSYPRQRNSANNCRRTRVGSDSRQQRERRRPLALLSPPFCQSLCWFCGCTTVITTQQGQSATYLKYLEKEMDLMKPFLNPKGRQFNCISAAARPRFCCPRKFARWAS